jgi:hypothetical protein
MVLLIKKEVRPRKVILVMDESPLPSLMRTAVLIFLTQVQKLAVISKSAIVGFVLK